MKVHGNLPHCLHRTRLLFQRIFLFGRMLWSWKSLSCRHCWLPRWWSGRVWNTPHGCLYSYLSLCNWNMKHLKFQRIFHFGRVCIGPEMVIVDIVSWFQRIFHFEENISLPGRVYCESWFRENFSLGGCIGPEMSNAVTGAVVIPLSLDLATW